MLGVCLGVPGNSPNTGHLIILRFPPLPRSVLWNILHCMALLRNYQASSRAGATSVQDLAWSEQSVWGCMLLLDIFGPDI